MKFIDRFHVRRNISEQYPGVLYNLEQCRKEHRLFILVFMVQGIGVSNTIFQSEKFKKILRLLDILLHKQTVKSFNEFLAKAPWSAIRAKV